MKPALVLFDIDGTLVLTGHAGVRALGRAFEDLYGATDALADVPIAGCTDRAIISAAFGGLGLDATDEGIAAVRDAYCGHLGEEILRDSEHPRLVLPGIETALADLATHPEVAVGLLTGNFAKGAQIKLGHFDLWRRFPFGAFGDRHVSRRDLVPVALAAAEHAGFSGISANRIIVVGDTPLDVDCAHAFGAKAVAVATGTYTREQLEATGAEVVVDDLSDWPAIWKSLDLES